MSGARGPAAQSTGSMGAVLKGHPKRRRGYGVLTLSIIKADTGGYVGHSAVHPRAIEVAQKAIDGARGDLLIDGQVSYCGDDLSLIMTHNHGVEAGQVHGVPWAGFLKTTAVPKELGPYRAGHDLLSDPLS